jgi:peptide/nickel transport system permease protein
MSPILSRYLSAFTSPRGFIGLAMLVFLLGVTLFAPVIWPGGYDQQSMDSWLPMSFIHPFGTDEFGRDIFSRAIYGLRTNLSIVVLAVPLSMTIGVFLGLLGIYSDTLGHVAQRFLDIVVGFPSLILGISIVLLLGAGWHSIFVAVVLYGLPSFGRLSRSVLLEQQEREYVKAARVLGVSRGKIMTRHILPFALDPIIVQGAVFTVGAVFIEAALSIVGLGLQPPAPSLGTLLNVGLRYVYQQPAYVLGPTLVLIVLALAFTLIADALNAAVLRT